MNIGLSAPVRLLHVTDSHISRADETDFAQCPELEELARCRFQEFGGPQSEDYYLQSITYAMQENILLVHTGDLIDFLSNANFAFMDETLWDVDYIYAAGNHDFCHFVGRAVEDDIYKWENIKVIQPHVRQNLYFDSRIVGGVNVVTMDDSYYRFTKGQKEMLCAEVAKGYPILLCLHVPLYTPKLAVSMLEKNDCAFVIGAPREVYSCYPEHRRMQQAPDAQTREVIDYIKSERKIKGILAGHVHQNFEEPLENGVLQICTNAGYMGYVRELILN